MGNYIDLTGQRFGRLVVIERAENDSGGHTRWTCKCDCGKTKLYRGWSVEKALTTPAGSQQHLITYNGKTQSIKQWANELRINENTLRNRINRKWSIEKALNTSVKQETSDERL